MTAKEIIEKTTKSKFWNIGHTPYFVISSSIIGTSDVVGAKVTAQVQIVADCMLLYSNSAGGDTKEEAEEKAYQVILNTIVFEAFESGYIGISKHLQKQTTEFLKKYATQPGRKKK